MNIERGRVPIAASGGSGRTKDAGEATVCLVISSFRNDDSIREILLELEAAEDHPFSRIIIVDSMGTGAIPALIEERGWSHVQYFSYEQNLGSAGNLAERLRLAASSDADYAYAINHDGKVDPTVVRLLLGHACSRPRVGAVYPLRYLPHRRLYDVTGRWELPVPFRGAAELPAEEAFEVYWSSSNGALYSLEPIRRGITPWADLWMGWEDMGYGWALRRNGYQQFVLTGAVALDNYEYRSHTVGGRAVALSDKPAWYAYYHIRNLLIIARRNRQSLPVYLVVWLRALQEMVLTAGFRKDKGLRLRLLLAGIGDGLRNRTGKGAVP